MACFNDMLAAAYHTGRMSGDGFSAADGSACVTLVPACACARFPRLVTCGNALFLETLLPTSLAGWAVVCRMPADVRALPVLQHAVRRGINDRRYAQMIAGMVLLAAVCGWIIGGNETARWLVEEATRPAGGSLLSPEIMQQRFGARRMQPAEWPALFSTLHDLCCRAGLPQAPDLYCIAGQAMNAYALGGPEKSAITLTEGLLRGMSIDEISGILAHEIAHIRSDDTGAMALAAALHRAIGLASQLGLMGLERHRGHANRPLELLLSGASTIAHLLLFGLSRLQETDADGLAAELTGDPRMLVAALHKLECHYNGFSPLPAARPERGVDRYLRSHPATQERVGMLLGLVA